MIPGIPAGIWDRQPPGRVAPLDLTTGRLDLSVRQYSTIFRFDTQGTFEVPRGIPTAVRTLVLQFSSHAKGYRYRYAGRMGTGLPAAYACWLQAAGASFLPFPELSRNYQYR